MTTCNIVAGVPEITLTRVGNSPAEQAYRRLAGISETIVPPVTTGGLTVNK